MAFCGICSIRMQELMRLGEELARMSNEVNDLSRDAGAVGDTACVDLLTTRGRVKGLGCGSEGALYRRARNLSVRARNGLITADQVATHRREQRRFRRRTARSSHLHASLKRRKPVSLDAAVLHCVFQCACCLGKCGFGLITMCAAPWCCRSHLCRVSLLC